MPETPAEHRLVIELRDLPPLRLLIVELEALLLEMEPGPERDRLEHALGRITAELSD